MSIRREDKEFIQKLSLVGAFIGAIVGLILLTHLSKNAHQQHQQISEYQQAQAALIKLHETVVNPNNPMADKKVLENVQEHIQQPKPVVKEAAQGFWIHIPQWSFFGICAAGCAVGAAAGYVTVMVTGWIGMLMVLYIIRLLYTCIRKAAPVYAKSIHIVSEANNKPGQHGRDKSRILPTLVKLSFLLVLVLVLLAAVVWRMTAL